MPDPANARPRRSSPRIEQLVRDGRRQHVLAQPRGPHAGREPQVHEGEAIAAVIADQHDVCREPEREAAAGRMTRHRRDDRNRAVEEQPGQQDVRRAHLAGGEPQQQFPRRAARERVALARQHDDADARVAVERLERVLQRVDHRFAERVRRARVRKSHAGDAVDSPSGGPWRLPGGKGLPAPLHRRLAQHRRREFGSVLKRGGQVVLARRRAPTRAGGAAHPDRAGAVCARPVRSRDRASRPGRGRPRGRRHGLPRPIANARPASTAGPRVAPCGR